LIFSTILSDFSILLASFSACLIAFSLAFIAFSLALCSFFASFLCSKTFLCSILFSLSAFPVFSQLALKLSCFAPLGFFINYFL
jgi:hypothetical protein